MQRAHESPAHRDQEETMLKLEKSYQWPNMQQDIAHFVAKCANCQNRAPREELDAGEASTLTAQAPGEVLIIECRKMPRAQDGSMGVMILIDSFSDFCVARAVPEFSAEEAVELIWDDGFQSAAYPK